ncbi:MAG: hypothetical protein R3Y13_02030 [bacterium]
MDKEYKIKLINNLFNYDLNKVRFYFEYYNKEKLSKLGILLILMKRDILSLKIEYSKKEKDLEKNNVGNSFYVKKEELLIIGYTIEEYELFIRYIQTMQALITNKLDEDSYKATRNDVIKRIVELKVNKRRAQSFIDDVNASNADSMQKKIAKANLLDSKDIRDNFLDEIDLFTLGFSSDELELMVNSIYKVDMENRSIR